MATVAEASSIKQTQKRVCSHSAVSIVLHNCSTTDVTDRDTEQRRSSRARKTMNR